MASPEEIVEQFDRMRNDGQWHKERMRQVAEVTNGDIIIPLPELGANEKTAVANLVYRGLQSMSQNLSSVRPRIKFGPLKPTKAERNAANLRQRIAAYWDQEDRTDLLDAQRARYLFGYGVSPVRVDTCLEDHRPGLVVPSPLVTYTPRPKQVNDICPPFGIAAMQMNVATIVAKFGGNPNVMTHLREYLQFPETLMWVLDYADDEEFHLVLGAPVSQPENGSFMNADADLTARGTTLHKAPNRTDLSPWVEPRLINLDKMQGHFDQMLGMYHVQALLTALELQHAARSVFQETWLVARPGEVAEVATEADPITGTVGEIRGGDLHIVSPDPQFHTHMAQDRLQEAAMMTGGLPPDLMGRAGSNVRTGRRADQLLSAAQDPVLLEAQTVMAAAREEEIKRKIAFDKAYFGREKTITVTWRAREQEDTYTASEVWKTDRCRVEYAMPGVSASDLIVMVGQMLGMELIGKREAREILPFFDDPDGTEDMVTVEVLERTFQESLAAQIMSPESPLQPRHLAELVKRVRDRDEDLVTAYEAVMEAAREEQTQPVPEGDPTAALGLDGPGAVPPPVEGPSVGTDNVADLFGRLRMPHMRVRTPNGAQV